MAFPILTLPDPLTTGEGALDPLGLSTIADRLADQILPGLRARMSRPRFLTAMAVCAAVCDGIEDQIAADGATPAYIVFEWLVVEGFSRAAPREDTQFTPGMLKAQAVRESGEPMRASAYLRIPTIFGYHGIYKPLARHMGVVDDDMRLGDHGYALLKEWQAEQNLAGFLPTAAGEGPGTRLRETLRAAVDEALKKGCTTRSSQWKGWGLLAGHLAPAKIGAAEGAFLHRLLLDARAGTRAEVFRLLEATDLPEEMPEARVVTDLLLQRASADLKPRLHAIAAYEAACTLLEAAFDWIRHLSSIAGARAITAGDFAKSVEARAASSSLPTALRRAEDAIAELPLALLIQQEMALLAKAFDGIKTPEDLYEAVLTRHHEVQQAKKPDGKRDWFERSGDGSTFVRVPYRMSKPLEAQDKWNRPYRIDTVRSFIADLKVGAYAPA